MLHYFEGGSDVTRFGVHHWLVVGVLAAFVLGAVAPASASYDKLYRF